MLTLLLVLLSKASAMPSLSVDPTRLDAEMAADADVMRSLHDNGDVPSIRRPVDVRFVGSRANVASLEREIGPLGWRIIQRVPMDDGDEALDVQREQTTEMPAIRQLTETALQIEVEFGVRYDGWGTVATKR